MPLYWPQFSAVEARAGAVRNDVVAGARRRLVLVFLVADLDDEVPAALGDQGDEVADLGVGEGAAVLFRPERHDGVGASTGDGVAEEGADVIGLALRGLVDAEGVVLAEESGRRGC